jgi:hypothetical protein
MALILKDRVKETTTTTGTGTVTLAGAVQDYQSFAAIGNLNTTYYTIALSTSDEWEVGIGVYTASGTTLSRDTVLASSNSGSLVNFSAGEKDVFVVYPAGKSVVQDEVGTAYVSQLAASNGVSLTKNNISSSFTIPTDYNGFAVGPQTVDSGVAFTIPSGSRYIVI